MNRWTVWLSETHFQLRVNFISTKKNCQVSGGNLIKFSIFEKCSTRCFCEPPAPAIDKICLVRSFQWNTLSVLWPHLNHSECTLCIAQPYSLGNFFSAFCITLSTKWKLDNWKFTAHLHQPFQSICSQFMFVRVRIKKTLQRYEFERERMNSQYASGL